MALLNYNEIFDELKKYIDLKIAGTESILSDLFNEHDTDILIANIDDIIAVADEIAAVSAAGTNIESIIICADNIQDIIDAPSYAAEAKGAYEFSHKWAVEDENIPVDDGIHPIGYSAYHWAQKAEDSVMHIGNLYSVKEYGATGDGVTDDTIAIQAGIDDVSVKGGTLFFPPGKYLITAALQIKNNVILYGVGVADSSYYIEDLEWDPTYHSFIFYDGSADANSAMLNYSRYNVGEEPDPNGTQYTVSNSGIFRLGFDGNNKADIGIYMVRPRGLFKQITIRHTNAHAIWMSHASSCTFELLDAVRNNGAGITLAKNIFAWTRTWADDCVFIKPITFANGKNTPFDPTTINGRGAGYGFGIFSSRGVNVIGISSAKNLGANIYINNDNGQNVFSGGYCEFGTYNYTTNYDVVIESKASSWTHRFEGMRFGHNVMIRGEQIYREEASYIFESCGILGGIVDSTIKSYQLKNCPGGASSITFPGTKPNDILGVFGNVMKVGAFASCTFNAMNGTIEDVHITGGITNITYDAVGTYSIHIENITNVPAVFIQTFAHKWARYSFYTSDNKVTIRHYLDDGVTLTDEGAYLAVVIF